MIRDIDSFSLDYEFDRAYEVDIEKLLEERILGIPPIS